MASTRIPFVVMLTVVLCLLTGISSAVANDAVVDTDSVFTKPGVIDQCDFDKLGQEISPENPLLLLIRNAKAEHNHREYTTDYFLMKYVLINGYCHFADHARFNWFDAELTEEGEEGALQLREELENCGWTSFLDSIPGVQYLCSPQSRSIQTALLAMPGAKFTVDENIRHISPLGPNLRRSFETKLAIRHPHIESIQEKFSDYSDSLVFQWANCESYDVRDRFGYYTDVDPTIESRLMEKDEDFTLRVKKWLMQLLPDRDTSINHPSVYVMVADADFIMRIAEILGVPRNDKDPLDYCEIMPIVMHSSQLMTDHKDIQNTYRVV